jgi:actin-like ATPase involved in cell morphogenesis
VLVPFALGIDVGTTFTAAAAWRDGRAEVVALETHRVTVPTVVFADAEELIFGTAAVTRGAAHPAGAGREFKRRLGDPVPIMLSGAPYSADRLVALFARWVVDTVTEQFGEAPSAVVLTHPANWTEFQTHLLRNGLGQVGLADAGLLTEPQAAAHDFGAVAQLTVGDVVLVYDLGGGTFDVALLRRDPSGFVHVGEPAGAERLGGIDFDQAVFEHVVGHLPPAVVEQANAEAAGRMALVQLRRACVEAKEALSAEVAVDIPVVLPGHSSTVRVTRAELEGMIRPMLGQTIDLSQQVLAGAGISADDLSAILLVGGSSRIPLVSELVRDRVGVRVRVDAHPKLVVARGAARWAGEAPQQRVAASPGAARSGHRRRDLLIAAGAVALVAVGGGVWYAAASGGDDPDPDAAGTTDRRTPVDTTTPNTTVSQASQPTTPPSAVPPATSPPSTVPALPAAVRIVGIEPIGVAEVPAGTVDGHPLVAMTALTSEPGTNNLFAVSDTVALSEAALFGVTVDLEDGRLDDGDVTVGSATPLRNAQNQPYGDELGVEALARIGDGNMLIGSLGADLGGEVTDLFLHELTSDGKFVREWELPDWYLRDPANDSGLREDSGLSSLTALGDDLVLAGFRYTLRQDEDSPEFGDDKHVRLLAYDASSAEPVAEYFYPLDPTNFEAGSEDHPVSSALRDLAAIDGTSTVVAVERSLREKPMQDRLYWVTLDPSAAAVPSAEGPQLVLRKQALDIDLGDPPELSGEWHSITEGPRLSDGRRSLILVRDSKNPNKPLAFRAYAIRTEPAP